jgi:predicted metal-dependent hydrolase
VGQREQGRLRPDQLAGDAVMQAPGAVVDYVLAHELTHLLHEDHGRDFGLRWAGFCPTTRSASRGFVNSGRD